MIIVVAFSSATAFGVPPPTAGLKTFVNQEHSYSVQYPDDWYLAGDTTRFYIHSFPPSKAVRGTVLPKDGAEITIAVPVQRKSVTDQSPRTLEEWVRISTAKQSVIGRRTLEVSDGRSSLSVVEITSHCCTVPPFIESHQWFFEVQGRMVRASLGFWENNTNTESFFKVFKSVVLSLHVEGNRDR